MATKNTTYTCLTTPIDIEDDINLYDYLQINVLFQYVGGNSSLFLNLIEHAKNTFPILVETCRELRYNLYGKTLSESFESSELLYEKLHYMKSSIVYFIHSDSQVLKDFDKLRNNHEQFDLIDRLLFHFSFITLQLFEINILECELFNA